MARLCIRAIAYTVFVPFTALVLIVIVANILNLSFGPGRVENFMTTLLPAGITSLVYLVSLADSRDKTLRDTPRSAGGAGWLIVLVMLWIAGVIGGFCLPPNSTWFFG